MTARELIEKRIIDLNREKGLFPSAGCRVLAAVSGGADSVCMLNALAGIAAQLKISIVVAHYNHSTRGEESDADERFVEGMAEEMGLDFISGRLDPELMESAGTGSREADLREMRRAFLTRAARVKSATRIALAHNSDDQAETSLMRLIRGSSPSGVAAMRPVSGSFVRPLLYCSRPEIEAFCAESGLAFRTDSSNADMRHTRNRMRLSLLPLIESEFNPRARENIVKFADLLRDDIDLLEMIAGAAAADALIERGPGRVAYRRDSLAALPEPLLRRALRNSAASVLGGLAWRIENSHIEAMTRSCVSPGTGAETALPGGARMIKKYDSVEIVSGPQQSEAQASPPRAFKAAPGIVALPEFGIELELIELSPAPRMAANDNPFTAYLDADALGDELIARSREPGDVFQPLGMKSEKKLSDFFIDAKVDRSERETAALLTASGGIAWVVGHRISHRFRVGGHTTRVMRISARPLGEGATD
ncbi:MAG: tRNA(Ile)-lysidine synthase [bacterium ADurb.Bin236]|nr:MAG: tRNA(Ile)-lysidine synthase [bacterium ADurb.Bin236]HOY62006.1 tRNA lysidine(34) synthetase TilS [bacterium]